MLVKPKESSVVSRWRFICLFIRWTPLRGTRRVTLIPVLVIAEEIVSVCVRPLLRTHTSAVNTECLSSGGPRNCAVSNRNVKKPQSQSRCLTLLENFPEDSKFGNLVRGTEPPNCFVQACKCQQTLES